MYQAPSGPNRAPNPGAHFSTSSSVYSPLESEFGFDSKNASHEMIEEVDEEEEEGNDAHKPLEPDQSMQTFDSYRTAASFPEFGRSGSNPSFTSINESILRNPSNSNLEEYNLSAGMGQNQPSYDNDATPIITGAPFYHNDAMDDKTPIMGVDSFDNPINHEVSNPVTHEATTKSSKFPQQELSSKFKRLSMTLQQSRASGDSYHFMSTFQQNVEKVNNDTNGNRLSTSKNPRTSLYYKKIHQPHGPDGDDYSGVQSSDTDDERQQFFPEKAHEDDEISVLNHDAVSEISTISNRSSIISQSSDLKAFTLEDKLNGLKIVVPNETTSLSQPYNPSSSNYPGTKITPLKVNKKSSIPNDNDVPARKDLVYKYGYSDISDTTGHTLDTNKYNMSLKYPNGLNVSMTESALDPKNDLSFDYNSRQSDISNQTMPDDEDLSSLFIRALHPFDSSTLQSESDASICLSFEKDDLAFVHTIDDSGWGEVTLMESLQRGWIPMNYFGIAVADESENINELDEALEDDENNGKIPNSHYLKPLFHACGRFLMNPLSHKNRRGKYTFSIRLVNSIRDGVRLLLQQTDCLSRSNEIVTKRPIVRKSRKSLLADWYNLMVKANEFKGTSNFSKIEVLILMIYQVTRKATTFLQVWSIESKQIIKRENEKKLQTDMNNYPLLSNPPLAKHRIVEISGLLYSYLGMIIGRLDLIEHNPVGCDILESLTHQIILLLRELLFISKTGSDFSSRKPSDLDSSLDTLLSLVSDLVSGVKNLVMSTFNESEEEKINSINLPKPEKGANPSDYYYTREGGELIQVAAKMIKAIGITISSIRDLLENTGDFKLNAERSYPDYSRMKIDPEDFIRKCSLGIAKAQGMQHKDLKSMKSNKAQSSNRYSMMRSGKTGSLSLTTGGATMLHDLLCGDVDGSSPFLNSAEFEPYTNNSENTTSDIKDELLVDSNGNLLGASFKGLVYTLTNENSPPEYFFVSTFFLCFRSFANGFDFIEEMITRFDITNKSLESQTKQDISFEIKLKNRRRLIVKMFQLWMESYWNHEQDFKLLTTLINFANEGISQYLPFDALKIIEIAAKLFTKPLIEKQKEAKVPDVNKKQLINRSITITRSNRKNSIVSGDITSRYSMVDGYELSKINTNSSTSSLKSMSLPMPLGIGNQTSSSSSLLSKNQLSNIEKVNLSYRAILDRSWCPSQYITAGSYIPLDLVALLPNWYNICEQNWVLSNYRPNLLDFNGLEIAKQLTLMESHIFCSFKPEELLNENYTAKRAHLRLAPNIRQSLLFTNCLSGYVLESVLQPKINQKLRINIFKTWLKIAISCLYLRNFNSLASIITSLQSHLITRLTRVWAELSEKYKDLYDYLSGIIHPDKNYNVYRKKLRKFLVSNDYNIPIVPYCSLFLQDITFVTDGNPSYRNANTFLNQKLINIDKYLKTTRIIADIESLQIPYTNPLTTPRDTKRSSLSFLNTKSNEPEHYNIIPVQSLQELILLELWKVNQLNKTEEDRAWKLSCMIQPREAN